MNPSPGEFARLKKYFNRKNIDIRHKKHFYSYMQVTSGVSKEKKNCKVVFIYFLSHFSSSDLVPLDCLKCFGDWQTHYKINKIGASENLFTT